jgi:tetratricopeptide (TPR) repeat protein
MTPTALLHEYGELVSQVSQKCSESPEKCEELCNKYKREADELFSQEGPISRYRMAFRYQAAARIFQELAESSSDAVRRIGYYGQAGLLYHFAAHGFRKEEEYRWAGEAYERSGDCFQKEMKLYAPNQAAEIRAGENAVRAYARAMRTYGDVGDFALSGKAYLEEQKLLQGLLFKKDFKRGLARAIWGLMTGYGESVWRWFCAYVLGILVFALANSAAGLCPVQALSVSIERSLLISGTETDSLLLISQFAYSYFNLGLGLTLIVRKMSSR